MQVSVTEAKGQLTELVRRAEAGNEIILTRHGQAAVRLVPVHPPLSAAARPCSAGGGAIRGSYNGQYRPIRGEKSGFSLR